MRKIRTRFISTLLICSMLFSLFPKQIHALERASIPLKANLKAVNTADNTSSKYHDIRFEDVAYQQNVVSHNGKIFVPINDVKNFTNYTWVESQSAFHFKDYGNNLHFRRIHLDLKKIRPF